ncbi:MAG: glycerate kinase [Burkholderiales bacterium]|nr:glycerate kinase [Burkholderiales bacterium]
MSPRELLIDSFRAALSAADPLQIVPAHLPAPPKGRTVVVGAGKAAAAMAKAVETEWPADAPIEGVVITRYAHGYASADGIAAPAARIRVLEAGHPVPDEAGVNAAKEILALAQSLNADDLLLVLVSGGGSSLLSLPVAGITMTDLKAVTSELLACGAPIQEMNIVRKHLSAIQGGRLAAATAARVLSLIISDVTGDDPSAIASGPTAPDPSTYQDALDILSAYRIVSPLSVIRHLSNGARGDIAETLKPGDAIFELVENRVIATPHASLSRAAAFFQQRGITPMVLGDSVTGEAREVAKVHAALTRQIQQHHHPLKPPMAIISGGECTVTLRTAGVGRGGRCSEFLLSLAIDLDSRENVFALACDTDGIDGSEDNAGAYLEPGSLRRARLGELQPKALLGANDAYGFFSPLDDLIFTGPTRTNVNDYRVILIL